MNEGDIHVTVTAPSAISLERGAELLRETRLKLLTFPEVKDVLTEQGHPEDGTDDEAPNQAETFVIMKPESEWHTGRKKEQIVDAMRAELEKRPGVVYNFSQPIKDRVEESISGIRGQIVVKIYGEDLQPHAREARGGRSSILTSTRGSRDVEIYRAGTAAARRRRHRSRGDGALRPPGARRRGHDRERLRRSRRRRRCGRASAGRRAREAADAERGRRAIRSARLDVPERQRPTRIPLAPVADIHVDRGRTQINREQGGRFLAIKCNIEGRDMGSFVDEAQARVRAQVKLPEGYYMTWGGEFENQRRAMKRLVDHRADLDPGDPRAALPDVPGGAAGDRRAARRAVRDGGRRLRALSHPHRALGVGGGRVHHAVRRRRHGRRPAHHLRAPGARADTRQRGRDPATPSRSGCGRC